MKIRVYYEDTDAGGVVYHANYLKFCERARSEIFFRKNLKPIFDGYHFVVKSIQADFIAPARLGDLLVVKTRTLELKKASIVLLQEIFLETKLIFKTIMIVVCIKNGKIVRIPEYFANTIKGTSKNRT